MAKVPDVSKQGKLTQGKASPAPGMDTKNSKTGQGAHRGGNNYNQVVIKPLGESFVVNQIPKTRKSNP